MEQDSFDFDDETQEGLDELGILITLFAGQVWRGASADEAIAHTAQYGETIAPQMAAQIDPAAGPKAAFFRMLGRAMWNNLPQPAHGFRLVKLPEPGRNDPCYCGSLRKFKQCCARMPEFPMEPAMMLDGLLRTMPRKRWSELSGSAIDRHTVEHLVFLWQEAGAHEDVATLLDPWFKGEGVIRDNEAELLDMLLEAYLALDRPRKRKTLAQAAIARGEKTARSIGWQRIALMEADKGDYAAAHKALMEAQRADPDNLNLGPLEVHLLITQGNAAMAQERAKYWALRLVRLNDPGVQSQINWLREVALNPQAAMMEITRQGDAAIRELEALLHDAPSVSCHYRLESMEGSAGPFIPQPKLGRALRDWCDAFPANAPMMTQMTTWNEAPWDEPGVWLKLLREQPLLWQSFEVLDDLVIALDGCGLPWAAEELIPLLLKRALALFDLVLSRYGAMGLRCEWGWHENRPALRLLVRKVVDDEISMDEQTREEAFALMRRLVETLNPNDNHGFRVDVVARLIEHGEVEQAIAIAERYPDDMADMQYTHALALHVAGREDEARDTALAALGDRPRLGQTLIAESPRKPRNDGRQGYALGSPEEAWLYREKYRTLWEKLGALPWLAGLARGKA